MVAGGVAGAGAGAGAVGGLGGAGLVLADSMGAVSAADAESSRQRFVDFLQRHKAYELLPESGKVVALDVALPVKQAFHALYEQGVPAAPLWDSERQEFVGMLSASDFISILTQLHCNSASLSEEELETHTIAAWKEEKLALATPLDAPHTPARRPLIYVRARSLPCHLFQCHACSCPLMPVAGTSFSNSDVSTQCYHAVLSRMHVLLTPPSPPSHLPHSVPTPFSPPSLPLSIYTSTVPDITTLAKDHMYARLNIDEFTVGQALQYRQDAGAVGAAAAGGTRCHMCLQSDSLRVVVERLAMPGVRRLVCVEAGSRRIQGIISLSDLFHFLLS
ncbi:unnamed protein product [Closterium sp. NIES-54]